MSRSEYPSRHQDRLQKNNRRQKYAAASTTASTCQTKLSNHIFLPPCYVRHLTCYPFSYHSRANERLLTMNDASRSLLAYPPPPNAPPKSGK
jgi:hypothetical protein